MHLGKPTHVSTTSRPTARALCFVQRLFLASRSSLLRAVVSNGSCSAFCISLDILIPVYNMAPRTRLVRRAPLTDRVKAYLNPYDFLLWLSEELTGNDWEEFNKQWALPLGIALNIIFVLARANSTRPSDDDVFGDNTARFGSGWLSWLVSNTLHLRLRGISKLT